MDEFYQAQPVVEQVLQEARPPHPVRFRASRAVLSSLELSDPGKGSYWTVDLAEELSTARVRNRKRKTLSVPAIVAHSTTTSTPPRASSPPHLMPEGLQAPDSPIESYISEGSDSEEDKRTHQRAASESAANFAPRSYTFPPAGRPALRWAPITETSASYEEAALLQSLSVPRGWQRPQPAATRLRKPGSISDVRSTEAEALNEASDYRFPADRMDES